MQLRMVARRSSGPMTVLGDIAQSTGYWARDDWSEVIECLGRPGVTVTTEELKYGYRVPKRAYALAERLLPIAAPGVTVPIVVRDVDEEPSIIRVAQGDRAGAVARSASGYAARGLMVGVVCPDSLWDEITDGLSAAQINYADVGTQGLASTINMMSPEQAKGLEVDAVVVVEPETIIAEHERGERMLYVALTRTTRGLSVVFSGADVLSDVTSGSPLPPKGADAGRLRIVGDETEEGSLPTAPVVSGPNHRIDHQPTETESGNVANRLLVNLAKSLAEEIRTSVRRDQVPLLLEELRRLLGDED